MLAMREVRSQQRNAGLSGRSQRKVARIRSNLGQILDAQNAAYVGAETRRQNTGNMELIAIALDKRNKLLR